MQDLQSPASPDGDAESLDSLIEQIRIPGCSNCNGVLMPNVVFFGGTVPRSRVNECIKGIECNDALLVIGSSLSVYSGFRFCRRARELNKPIVLINPGESRADDLAHTRFECESEEILTRATQLLGGQELRDPAV